MAEQVPCEQLQVISVNRLGNQINNIPLQEARRQSQQLAALGSILLHGFMPDIAAKTVFAQDAHNEHIKDFVPVAEEVLQSSPALSTALSEKGAKHGSDFVSYGAAHLANQDTGLLELEVIAGDRPVSQVGRVVAVGCQQERTFYDLRMAMLPLVNTCDLVPSVQIFTNHVSPPYYTARHGEQSLEDALANGVCLDAIGDMAAERDIKHFVKSLGDM